ncbi:Metallo-hydrolase/oxidoreductase [Parathielavia hyrcaniae]|uniref:Metallo-hydrolase/oxidoreductase n=1 Tax=Parathielavia hyrcaniae TaxID=113614 RepID=A0AAN6SXC5_9PEZI|nr:Metallo-hydrolase/oxidoreductase [Parathielavia hyrcaniae]
MLRIGAITKPNPDVSPAEHHVVSTPATQSASGWASYIPSWAPSPPQSHSSLSESKVAGFRNPWPSWHKPTTAEIWKNFQWGDDNDGCLELAASHLANDTADTQKPEQSKLPRFGDINHWPNSLGAKAARLLCVKHPDFTFPDDTKAKVTWLGHAGVLVQLPSMDLRCNGPDGPVRCLFDPMFSARCSPSKLAGPIRSYPPPCKVEDLPPIDIVCISHNHYDHMDHDSIMFIWQRSSFCVRFFVPLGNKRWLVDWKIPADRVVEMDWWDSVELTVAFPTPATSTLKIHCTPAQHNSFRTAGDADTTLWSSWYLELLHPAHNSRPNKPPFRFFFAGDTGYQFHPSSAWPPSPNNPAITAETGDSDNDDKTFPACPAFAEIRDRIAPPNLLLLPVSVGATFAYLRSFVPLPDWISPFPRHSAGVTGANHMPPWDAVRVLKVMTEAVGGGGGGGGGAARHIEGTGSGPDVPVPAPVAVAMHWGTFVTDPAEVLRTLGALEWACRRQGVRFGRELGREGEVGEEGLEPWFVAVHHGGSVCL